MLYLDLAPYNCCNTANIQHTVCMLLTAVDISTASGVAFGYESLLIGLSKREIKVFAGEHFNTTLACTKGNRVHFRADSLLISGWY